MVNNFQEGRNYGRLFLEKSSIIWMHIIFMEFETVETVDSCEVDTSKFSSVKKSIVCGNYKKINYCLW